LDVAQEMLLGYEGPLKTQICGPWTLAGTIELRSGRRALADSGAVRDLGQALVEAAAGHVAELAGRVPGAQVLPQVDAPPLPAGPAGPDAGREVAAAARALWRRTGLASELLGTVAVTPTCGLAGSSQGAAGTALRLCRAAARTLVDDPEELAMDDLRG